MATRVEDYTVGWISAIPIEYAIACELLDEEYKRNEAPLIDDQNPYTFGRFYEHHTVITCLAKGQYGTVSAAVAAERMRSSFPAIRINLLVGIAGGVPSPEKHDLRLGDVVVSVPGTRHSGVIQYGLGKLVQEQDFEETGSLAPPPGILLGAITHLDSQHQRRGSRIVETMEKTLLKNEYLKRSCSLPTGHRDRLYRSSYVHAGAKCDCQLTKGVTDLDDSSNPELIRRGSRGANGPAIHYGLVASADLLMKDAEVRDTLAAKYGILCFEMEAAGLMNNFPCVVIRGISDYADTHKNDQWQGYAAATAAIYAKELIEAIPRFRRKKDEQTIEQDTKATQQTLMNLQPSYVTSSTNRFDIGFSLERVPIAKKFIGRTEEIHKLGQNLLPEVYHRRKIFVLCGLGGIGKTQLAIEFMRLHYAKFSAVLWLNASSEDNLQKDLASYVGKVKIQSGTDDRSFIKGNYGDNKELAQGMLNWLSNPENNKWLLIYDNLNRGWNPSTSFSAIQDIEQYLPTADHGSIIITTRLRELQQLGESQEVESVDKATAQAILRSWYRKDHDDVDGEKLCEHLSGLPLAIAQAGAYLQQSARGIKRYLQLYEKKHSEIASLVQAWKIPLSDYRDRSMWTTWMMSFSAVLNHGEHVGNMLVLWSFLDPNDLWYGLFQSAVNKITEPINKKIFIQALSKWLGKAAIEESSFDDTMRLLRSFSLIEGSEGTDGYTMHPLVHRWTYLYHGRQNKELGLLALAVAGLAMPVTTARDFSQLHSRLIPHGRMCVARSLDDPEHCDDRLEEHIRLQGGYHIVYGIRMLGNLFFFSSKHDQASQMYRLALQYGEKIIGPNHNSTLQTVYSLGNLYTDQGEFDQAQRMYARALEGWQTIHGPEHVSTVRAARALAFVLYEQGHLDKAEKMYNQELQRSEKTFGRDHVTTLAIVDSLGLLYMKQRKFIRAEGMFSRALKGFEKNVGLGHPSTLWSLHHLGILQTERGQYEEAEETLQQALLGYQEMYGSEAMDTYTSVLDTMLSLGSLHAKHGNQEAAKIVLARALTGYKAMPGISSEKCLESEQLLAFLESCT